MSSNTMIDESRGPPLTEKLKHNILLLSTNMHRYTENSTIKTDISSIVKLIQYYVLFLIPSFTVFWGRNQAASIITNILNTPFTLCVVPGNIIYRCVITIIVFVFYLIHVFILLRVLLKNPLVSSTSNSYVTWMCWFLGFFCPILEIPTFNLLGFGLGVLVWEKEFDYLTIIAFIFGVLSAIFVVFGHYLSVAMYRCSPTVNFRGLLRPWPRYMTQYSHLQIISMVTAFAEGFLNCNNQTQMTICCVVLMVFGNPGVSIYLMRRPIFQNVEDSVHLAVCHIVGFICLLLLLVHNYVPFLSPSLLFTAVILMIIVFYLILNFISRRRCGEAVSRLYSIYKSSRPVLPPLTPVVFSNPLSNQITLSQEAYSVMQMFSSLGIETEDEFNFFLAVGAKMKVPSVRNIDFIKWGLNSFTSATTLLAASQLIQYFGGCARTETVILQKLREIPSYPLLFMAFIQHLEGLHADLMLDKPILLQGLCSKASAALSRCKRSIAMFWGSVLRRSNSAIREALCRVRNSIKEAGPHFEELMRCYPHTKQAISLYLSFLTEIKGEFENCNDYLNKLSTYFVARQGELELEEEAQSDFLTSLLQDETTSYNKYVSQLPIFAEHERQAMICSNSVMHVINAGSIVSFIAMIICFTYVIVVMLISIQSLPKFITMIQSVGSLTSSLTLMTTATRRLCLISSGHLHSNSIWHPSADSIANQTVLVDTVRTLANSLPKLVQDFMVSVAYSNDIVMRLNNAMASVFHHNRELEMGFSQVLKIMSNSMRSIVLLVPKAVSETGPIGEYQFSDYKDICNSTDLKNVYFNIDALVQLLDDFVAGFSTVLSDEINRFRQLLLYSMEILPAVFFGVFLIWTIISGAIAYKEAKFRAALFLSLPEQVASEFFRAESGRPVKKAGPPVFNFNTPGRGEDKIIKDKVRLVEKLHEFGITGQENHDPGLRAYVISMLFFLCLSALGMAGLMYYGYRESRIFDRETILTCFSVMRNTLLEFATFFVQEMFFDESYRIVSNSEMLQSAVSFLERSQDYQAKVAYGQYESSLNYRMSEQLIELWNGAQNHTQPDFSDLSNSVLFMHHPSYQSYGLGCQSTVYYAVLESLIEDFTKDQKKHAVNDRVWQEFDHFLCSHLRGKLTEASNIFLHDIESQIFDIFYITLLIFLACFIVLLIIFFSCVVPSIWRLKQFFDSGVHILCQVPHAVFQRSLFINKWFKGQINRSNFMALETHFNRSISPALQAKLVKELPESIYLFDLQGNYVNSPSLDASNLEDKTMKSILPLIADVSHDFQLLSVAESAMTKIAEAKDTVSPIVYRATSVNNVPIRLTFVGVSAAEAGFMSKDAVMRQYYSYIAILAKDVTNEFNQQQQYQQQKAHTIHLMKQCVLPQLADRVHDGERRISFMASIGSVMLMKVPDYQRQTRKDPQSMITMMQKLHTLTGEVLLAFPNVSMVSYNAGLFVFTAGLFNDEQNGRTEAIDSVQFASQLYERISKEITSTNREFSVKFSVCTGGPIYYKMLLDVTLVSFVTGDVVQIAAAMLAKAKPRQILIERTTYECIYGLKLDPQLVCEFEFNDKHMTLYAIALRE